MDIKKQELKYVTELLNITKKMLSAFNLEKLLKQILDASLELLKADSGSLMLIEENSKTLKIKAARGLSEEVCAKVEVNLGEHVSGWVAKEGKPLLLVGGLKNDSRFSHLDEKKSIKSSICVPLIVEKRVIGVLNLNNTVSDNLFSEPDLGLLSLLANQAAISIWSVRLYEETKKANEEIRLMQKKLVEKEKMAALGQFSAGIAHEINNPLTTIIGNAQYLMEHMHKGDFGWEEINDVKEAAQLSSRIIARLFKYCSPLEKKEEAVDVNDSIRQVVELAKNNFTKQGIKIDLGLDSNVKNVIVGLDEFREVIFNVIFNAKAAMPAGGTLTIKTKMAGTQDMAEVLISDTGRGIPANVIDNIFIPFFSTRKPQGLGLGLAVCKHIVDLHNGTIEVESRFGKGTTFIIKLPVYK
ncbi:MAG: ATP-binding protein [Candidatus Omnitrophica bacterium]|nr:ATP-binding protein [Candidatus Omnitrophota bacterium]MDD5429294.1 ATP-binding protein [Candidatus Omnitrophota bacterium]